MTDYVRPSYAELKTRIGADLAAFPLPLRKALAAAWGKTTGGLHGHLDFLDKENTPLRCSLERLYDWAELYGVPRLDATPASGTLLATGAPGAYVLAKALLRGTNGLDYSVVEAVALGAGTTAVTVRCTTVGADGNLPAGSTLTLIDPQAGVDTSMTADDNALTGGAPDEDVDTWRARVVEEWTVVTTRGARSGKPEDYRFWARSAHPSVTTALVQPHVLGIGTVLVRPICNSLVNRQPTAAVLDAVAALLYTKAPATADWKLGSPIIHLVNVSLDLEAAVDTAEHRAAIRAALNAAVLAEDTETAILATGEIDGAIATVTSQYSRLAPLANIAVGAGEVLVLGDVVYP